MDSDLALTLGLLFAGLSVPSILSAFSENRPPRISAVMLLLGSGLIAYAMLSQPGGYRLEQIPDVFFSILARII